MDQKVIDRELKFISGVLLDIETIDLPWSEFNQVSISYDWTAVVNRLKEIQLEPLTPEQHAQYNQIIERIRAQKDKILALDYTYPDID
jgi:hypothetical protein